MCIRIFVYGSLKPGEFNYAMCANRVIASQPAIAYGTLYDLPFGYPAMALGSELIHGYLLSFADAEILPFLDEFETHDLELLEPFSLVQNCDYARHLIEVLDVDERPLGQAWVYLMTLDQISQLQGKRVTSGKWSSKATI